MVQTIVAGNWKMNTTVQQAKDLASEMKLDLHSIDGVTQVVCPPFVSLSAVADILDDSDIGLGAQNMYHEASGPYTGEISPSMLASLCQFVILGHSERRQYFGEDDKLVNRKVIAALAVNLIPIMCVGESLNEREQEIAELVVERQIREGLSGVASPDTLVIAYEPVWAIGTGLAATPDVAQTVMIHIRKVLKSIYGIARASRVPLIYGGSVTPDNVSLFMRQENINGALVGGASLKPKSFVEIVRKTAEAKS